MSYRFKASLLVCLTPLSILFLLPEAHASGDSGCTPSNSLRQPGYSCAAVPFLTPGNDDRINAMLLMADSRYASQALPSGRSTSPYTNPEETLAVPFAYDFSGWIDTTDAGDSAASAATASATQSSAYADGEGDICRSIASGEALFSAALTAAKGLPSADAAELRASRASITQSCATHKADANWAAPTGLTSSLGKQFATYLSGTSAFYAGKFIPATIAFSSVSHSADPWLRETGLYMTGRAQLNQAQVGAFNDDYALSRDKTLAVSIDAAQKVFDAYLKVYPTGQYAASSRGLIRRLAWLKGDTSAQAALYDKAFAGWTPASSNVQLSDLANEFDSKLVQTPKLDLAKLGSPSTVAIVDMMTMRTFGPYGSTDQKPMTLDALQAQKPYFANAPALFDYLVALHHVYVDGKPDQALPLLPALSSSTTSLGYMGFSQQTLRGFALEDLGQSDKARALWLQLFPLAKLHLQRETLELALAMNYEQAGEVNTVFADDSLIRNTAIRSILLERDANAPLLRAQAQNTANSPQMRDLALYTLLYKELTRGQYADFLADRSLVPSKPSDRLKPFTLPGNAADAEYRCPAISTVAATLLENSKDPTGLICLAEFVRVTFPSNDSIDDSLAYSSPVATPASSASDAAPSTPKQWPTLGSAPSQFTGKPYQRIRSYRDVIGNAQASANDRAYALYRAINCFAPGGTSECGGNDLPKSVRKQWFNDLKAQYPDSKWAKSLRYYW